MATIKTVGVIGAGSVGRGIAEMAATRGCEVVLLEMNDALLAQAPHLIDMALQHQLEKWAITEAEKRVIAGRIKYSGTLADLKTLGLVIETLIEELAKKKELFRILDKVCARETVLASNTSTLSITEMAAATQRPERCIGLHFLQPVTRTRVVEVVRGLKTADATVQACMQLLETLEKTGVEVYESPGYITTRLIVPLINDAANLVMEGVATAEAVDTAMRLGFHMERGPLETADRLGLDTLLVMLERMWEDYGDQRYRPSPLLRKLVRAGHVGIEARQGFFAYDEDGDRIKGGAG